MHDRTERGLRDRLRRLAHAHERLAEATNGTAVSLHAAIATSMAEPIAGATGFFFLAQRGEILEYGCDGDGELTERSHPSALDLGPWATGGADGYAPFGFIRGSWCTVWVQAGGTLVGGAIITNLTDPPDETLRAEIEAIGAHAGALLRMRAALEEAERLSTTDVLTGAATRQRFLDALQRASDARDSYVVVYLDFDGFKQINDTEGHSKGDEILQLGAATLMSTVRSDELIARLGGDEFVALVRADPEDAKLIALRLTNALADVGIAASAGAAAVADGDPAGSLREADENMYLSKKVRKDRSRLTAI